MKNKPILTLADIARLAKVSKSTASRALNDSPLISEETTQRIKDIASQQNYCINVPARRLSSKESRTIALVSSSHFGKMTVSEQLFGMELTSGISWTLLESGYDLLLAYFNPRETQWAHQYLDSGRADGFIVLSPEYQQVHIRALQDKKAPFIIWGIPQTRNNYCSVSGDNVSGGRQAVEYLIQSGRRCIAFLGGPADEIEVQQRFTGYEAAMKEAGRAIDPSLIAYGDWMELPAAAAMKQLLAQNPDLDAVFANSDLMAIAAMDVIRQAGRRVPEDVAVIGYDDLVIAEHSQPPLTTIRQNVPLGGKLLAQNLLQYLSNKVITNMTIPVELVIRKSA